MPKPDGSKLKPWVIDPNDIDNRSVTWTDWLNGDTLSASTWSVVSGTITIVSSVFSSTVATVKVSSAAAGKASLLNHVTTAAGREKDRTVYFKVKSQ